MTTVGYILTTYPCDSETFIDREIRGLQRLGIKVIVLAARRLDRPASAPVVYRPSTLSLRSAAAMCHLLFRRPAGLFRIARLIVATAARDPREAVRVLRNLPCVGEFAQAVSAERVDRLHAGFLCWPASVGLALQAATGLGLGIAAHARDIFVDSRALDLKLARCDYLTVCNRRGMESLRARIDPKSAAKLRLIRHGLDPDDWPDPGPDTRARRPMVLCIGRLVEKKGFDLAIRAFAELRHVLGDWRLTIVGDGPLRGRLEKLVRQLALDGHVGLPGWRRGGQVRTMMLKASMLAAPSRVDADGDRDGIPNVVIEAMACRLPVIATPVGGLGEVVQHRQTGLVAPPERPSGLADAINQLAENEPLRVALAANARGMVEREFDLSRNVGRLAALMTGGVR